MLQSSNDDSKLPDLDSVVIKDLDFPLATDDPLPDLPPAGKTPDTESSEQVPVSEAPELPPAAADAAPEAPEAVPEAVPEAAPEAPTEVPTPITGNAEPEIPVTSGQPEPTPEPEPVPEAEPQEVPPAEPQISDKTGQAAPEAQAVRLDARLIPKFKNQLVKPPVYCPVSRDDDDETDVYVVDISQFKQQILPPGLPETTVWGYGGTVRDCETGRITYSRSTPGASFEAIRHVPFKVRWVNKLTGPHLFAVDPTLHWANPNDMEMDPPKPWPPYPPGFPEAESPVPIVTHLHGGEVSSLFDGHPDAWFTSTGIRGPAFCTTVYKYPNSQEPAALWYHDHAMGLTRLNVYAGLSGFYFLRDRREICCNRVFDLPKGRYEIPIVIQDRSFYADGSLAFTEVGDNPDVHPYWDPEFFGDTIMVNGKVWPNLDVERRQYRFRLLNGSNARFYRLRFSNGMTFHQIGTDGGFLPEPVALDSLLLAPAERADILVDFSCIAPGMKLVLTNDAPAPFPDGNDPDPDTTGKIMQFTVPAETPGPPVPASLPEHLAVIPALVPDAPPRILTLYEVPGDNGPLAVLLNGQLWDAPVSERPPVGATEDWIIANLTMDTHPVHLHLVEFLLLNRQDFKADEYSAAWEALNGTPPINQHVKVLPVEPYLIGCAIAPDDNEKGWKDTVRMNPGQVTRIRVRFAPQDTPVRVSKPGVCLYPFDPTAGPGYVWHCHILDHEDNEMMRPFKIRPF